MKKYLILISICLFVFPVLSEAKSKRRGKSLGYKLSRQCSACHGQKGVSISDISPNLYGQNKMYLEKQLNDFAAGIRSHQIMTSISKSLSAQEISAVADYYSKQN